MQKVANLAHVIETEKYIEEQRQKNNIPENVFSFIAAVCDIEREYLDLVEQWGNTKGIMKP